MIKKLIFSVIVIGGLVITGLIFKENLINLLSGKSTIDLSESPLTALKEEIETIQDNVSLPGPLRFNLDSPISGQLTIAGVIAETNKQRQLNGLAPLRESKTLNKAALLKVADMFSEQYFAHESPGGDGPAELAQQAGYDYIKVGENLALGNFASDATLVDAWLNSPGHRANILNKGYTEIGVSVKKGVFEGKTTWLAVQEFGTPAIACPKPSSELSRIIEQQKAELDQQSLLLQQKKQELDAFEPKAGPEYNNKVREYNNLVEQYNVFVASLKENIKNYNEAAEYYNTCLASYSD